ncbi:MAG: radical SAM protein [Nanoarchaeota archaeon]
MKKIIKSGINLTKVYLFKKSVPLNVAYFITNKCNSNCEYCDHRTKAGSELSFEQIKKVVDQFHKLGTIRLNLIGGEPLLRKDIGKVIDYIKSKGIMVHLYTNGLLIKNRIHELKNLDGIMISIDGPENMHDKNRGFGSHKKVLEAIKIIKQHRIPIYTITVLTKDNSDSLDYISELAKKEKIICSFNIISEGPNFKNVVERKPTREQIIKTFKRILQEKKTNPYIAHSSTMLKAIIKDEPRFKPGRQMGIVKCWWGLTEFNLDANGDLYSCIHLKGREKTLNVIDYSVKEAINYVKGPRTCKNCNLHCAIEYNFICSLVPEAVFNFLRLMKVQKQIKAVNKNKLRKNL